MKTALILHGVCPEEEFFFSKRPSPSNAWWLPWLQQQFLRAGWQCQTPELPHPYRPSYAEWKETFEWFKPQKLSLLVGHGAGAGFAVKYMQEHRLRLEKLLLVAPWLDPEREFDDFLQTALHPAALNNIGEVHLIFRKTTKKPNAKPKTGCWPPTRKSFFTTISISDILPQAKPDAAFRNSGTSAAETVRR